MFGKKHKRAPWKIKDEQNLRTYVEKLENIQKFNKAHQEKNPLILDSSVT
jgi:hypothetical protein